MLWLDQTKDIIKSFQVLDVCVLTMMLAGCSQVLSQQNFTPEELCKTWKWSWDSSFTETQLESSDMIFTIKSSCSSL